MSEYVDILDQLLARDIISKREQEKRLVEWVELKVAQYLDEVSSSKGDNR